MKKEYRNSIRTKKMIREAFAEMIGEKKMLASISVSELAERADIAKSTFYNHYDDVYAVAEEMMREMMEKLNGILDEMETDERPDYRLYVKKIFDFLKENEDIYKKLSVSPDAVYFIDKVKSVLSKRAFNNVNAPFLSKNKSVRSVQISFVAHACVDTMVDYFRGNVQMSFDQISKTVMSMLDRML